MKEMIKISNGNTIKSVLDTFNIWIKIKLIVILKIKTIKLPRLLINALVSLFLLDNRVIYNKIAV